MGTPTSGINLAQKEVMPVRLLCMRQKRSGSKDTWSKTEMENRLSTKTAAPPFPGPCS